MKLTISCPHCDTVITLHVVNDTVVSIESDGIESASLQEIKKTLSSHNIEFG